MEQEIRIDLGRLFGTLRNSKKMIILAGLVCALVAFGGSWLVEPRFETAVTFFAGTADTARQAAVLLELEETLAEVSELAETAVDGDWLRAEEVRETGFLRVTVRSRDAAEGKAIGDALAQVLPRRAEAVLGTAVTAADRAVLAERATVPDRGMAALVGFLAGAFGCGGVVAVREIFEVGKKKEKVSS